MKNILSLVLALLLSGCNSEYKTTIDNVVDIRGDVVLQSDVSNTEFRVFGTLNLNGKTLNNSIVRIMSPYSKVYNGIIENTYIGVRMSGGIPASDILAMKGMTREDARKYADVNLTPNGNHHMSVSGIIFRNVSKAVYVDSFVYNSIISNNNISNVNKMAFYLDADSHDNIIENNIIDGTGKLGWYGISKREALSIDASYSNNIRSNKFRNCNGLACIALYVNCGENGLPRPYDANNNRITFNTFENANIGIYVSSRSNIRGGLMHSCGGYSYPEIVDGTVISDNTFKNVSTNVKDKGTNTK